VVRVRLLLWVWSGATWLALALIAKSAGAVEIHTLITKNCQALSGVVVFVDDDAVTLIDLQGHSEVWHRDDIASVVLHNSVDNPLASISLDTRLQEHLYNVYLVDEQEVAFTGWAIGFIEELVVFFDL